MRWYRRALPEADQRSALRGAGRVVRIAAIHCVGRSARTRAGTGTAMIHAQSHAAGTAGAARLLMPSSSDSNQPRCRRTSMPAAIDNALSS